MDFHALVNKLNQLDRAPIDQSTQEGCGDPMPPPPPMETKPDVPPPSMSVNLNAHGIDNIENMMKLFVKVNPDMMPKADPMPTIAPPPTIMSITPELPPAAPMPDMDADNDDMPGGEKDSMMKMDLDTDDDVKGLDRDGDGDHDMDDHDLEKKKDEWVNEPDPEEKDIDYMVNKLAGGMNKGHSTFPKVSDGDNPMQRVRSMEGEDLRAQIKNELRKRLAEAKGAK